MHRITTLFALLLVGTSSSYTLLAGAPASAQGLDEYRASGPAALPQPEEHWIWKADLQFRHNPIGLMLANQFIWREHHDADGSVLYKGTYQQASFDLNVSPAFAEFGPALEFRPMNLFVYRIGYQALYFFGTQGYALSFPRSDSDFGEAVADRLEEEGAEESGIAHRLMVQQTTQVQMGKLVVRNQLAGYFHLFPERNFEGPFVRERMLDTLQANYDAMIDNTAALLYQPWERGENARILVGPYHGFSYAVRAALARHRVGAVFLVIPRDVWGRSVHSPRFYVQGGVNVVDPNRDDEIFVQGGLGFDLRLATRD